LLLAVVASKNITISGLPVNGQMEVRGEAPPDNKPPSVKTAACALLNYTADEMLCAWDCE
jgi:hypothetical protein